jgi:hypothetical protein
MAVTLTSTHDVKIGFHGEGVHRRHVRYAFRYPTQNAVKRIGFRRSYVMGCRFLR